MNCDQVFDILTRGPFPTGDASDAAVERHLSACHECRELAEALQPAVQLWHEALGDEEPSLPGYRGMYSEANVACLPAALRTALAEDAPSVSAGPVSAGSTLTMAVRPGNRRRWAAVFGLAAAMSILCAGVIWQVALPGGPGTGNVAAAPAASPTSRFQPTELGRQTLVSLGATYHCLPAIALVGTPPASLPDSAVREASYACCLSCHGAAAANRPSLTDQALLDQSCHVCHNY